MLLVNARSDETLKLARRDTTGEYDAAFDNDIRNLGGVLDAAGSGEDSRKFVDQARSARDGTLRGRSADAQRQSDGSRIRATNPAMLR